MTETQRLLRGSKLYRTVAADKKSGALNHCYLILSDDDVARRELCRLAAKAALCPHGGCDNCEVCEKINDGAYVALRVNESEKISVDDVSELIEDSYFTGFDGDLKVYVVSNMQGMNEKAQNKFLKTLEEPPEGVVFILGASQQTAVLATILSRCKKLYFEGFSQEQIFGVLTEGEDDPDEETVRVAMRAAVCGFGNLTRAQKLYKDVAFGEKFSLLVSVIRNLTSTKKLDEQLMKLKIDKSNIDGYLDIAETVFRLLLASKRGAAEKGFEELEGLSGEYDYPTLVNILELIIKCKRMSESNCNPQSIADALFIGILEVKYLCRK